MKPVEKIIKALKKNGITVQRYDALSSQSVYLKLDYGVLNSIRISDHPGKQKLNYRYNLLAGIRERNYDRNTRRFFFPMSDVDDLLQQILSDHNDRRTRYGDEYEQYMQNNLDDNSNKKGFWSSAQLV